ncbi:MAG TPA: SIMPL domain-containing protein [Candidatus Paceibacterota bacterium]
MDENKTKMWQALRFALFIVAIFLVVKTIGEIKGIGYVGKNPTQQNTISVSGEGEVFVKPDIAQLTFDVFSEKSTVSAAQEDVTKRMNEIIAYLKAEGIEEKDIKTINYQESPKYDYQARYQPCLPNGLCPPQGVPKLVGYTVTHSIQLKIRKIDDSGKILEGLGSRKVSNMGSLYFTVEDEKVPQNESRKMAIDDAREKAQRLARDLGVKLVRVVSFNESGNYPIYFKAEAMDRGADVSSAPPEIPTGENKISSNVTILYEIR